MQPRAADSLTEEAKRSLSVGSTALVGATRVVLLGEIRVSHIASISEK